MGNAGRVLMIPKGDYNAATTYERLDFVYYQGRSYVCKQASTGNAPTNTTYWQALTGDASAEIQALTNYTLKTGVKNLLPLTLAEIKKANPYMSWSGNVGTTVGVAFTVETENGVVTGIKANGTSTNEANLYITQRNINLWRPAFSTVTLSGSPSGADYNCCMKANKTTSGGATYIGEIYESGKTITLESTDTALGFWISIQSGQTVTDKMFYPQIEEGTAKTDFAPYAKTNVELTYLIKKKTATVTTSGSGNASIATDLVPYSAQILAINVTSGAENGAIAVAYKNLGASVNGLHVWAVDGTPLASTQLGIEVIYIDGADVT